MAIHKTSASFQMKIETGTCIVYVEHNEEHNLRLKICKPFSVTKGQSKDHFLLMMIAIRQGKTMGPSLCKEALAFLSIMLSAMPGVSNKSINEAPAG